ncbi:MAG TPA: SAM-dependent methyltransferase [Streptosporangiaceae bacterium]|nr:SAM-dependent methyltransferase [Streptosporangiaceae bacterium]
MPALPPDATEPDADDVIGVRYPNTARIWNYQLGGKDNFAVDREASAAANAMVHGMGVPDGADTAVESRHLLQRMTDYMLGQGVRQFLDLGSGLPNMANTHQIAHRVAPEARIVYVDIDPLVSTHAAALMAGPNVVTLRGDLREPEQVLGDPQVRELFDFGQPVGIMFMCVLHCLWDREDPWAVVRQFRDAVGPGSYLALSHMTDEAHPEAADGLFRMTQDLHWNTPLISRSRAGIARFFDGFTLVEPGLVRPAEWHPELDQPLRERGPNVAADEPVLKLAVAGPPGGDPGTAWHLCGVGVKDQR